MRCGAQFRYESKEANHESRKRTMIIAPQLQLALSKATCWHSATVELIALVNGCIKLIVSHANNCRAYTFARTCHKRLSSINSPVPCSFFDHDTNTDSTVCSAAFSTIRMIFQDPFVCPKRSSDKSGLPRHPGQVCCYVPHK